MATILDLGQGIPVDELPNVFERHYRGKSVRKAAMVLGLVCTSQKR